MNSQTLEEFLNEANKSTYANKSAMKASPTRMESEDYHYEKGDHIYHDTYFGGSDFIGGEIVYERQKPIWGMNYYGYILDPTSSVSEIYDFLRKSLMAEAKDIIPVRGPRLFESSDWHYRNDPVGTLDRFKGSEEIFVKDILVYRCDYHGGFVS